MFEEVETFLWVSIQLIRSCQEVANKSRKFPNGLVVEDDLKTPQFQKKHLGGGDST